MRKILAEIISPQAQGIEIGPLHSPWPLPEGAGVQYVDRYTKEELIKQYPEHKPHTICDTHIKDDGFVLDSIKPRSQDFLIASHVLEHATNPIACIETWASKLKPKCPMLLAVPNKDHTFDSKRHITPWLHLWADYVNPQHLEASTPAHYEEYLYYVDNLKSEVLYQRVDQLIKEKAHIHFHTWDEHSFTHFIQRVAHLLNLQITHLSAHGHEMLCTLTA